MPTSPEALAVLERYRVRTVALRAQFIRDFAALWPGAQALTNPALREAWLRDVAALIRLWRPVFRQLALNTYRQAAELDTGAVPAVLLTAAGATPALPIGQVVGSMAATAFRAILGAGRGLSLTRVDPHALAASAEGAARLALNAGRDAIQQTVEQDRLAVGWMRITDGDPCAFCAMLAARGPVYKSAEAAGFEADPVRGDINRYHDNCACQVVPVFTRTPLLPQSTLRAQENWTAAQRQAREADDLNRGTSNDALNALRRYMADQAA